MTNSENELNTGSEGAVENNNNILDFIGFIAPLFQKLIPLDNMINVSDKEKFLYYFPGRELNIGNVTGKPIPKGGFVPQALQSGNLVSGVISKEVYGIPFKSSSIPVNDYNGEVIGTINVAVSLKSQETLLEVSDTIASTSRQLASTAEEIASSAQDLSSKVSDVQSLTQEMIKNIEKTGTILNFVNEISSNTRLLGLNASIEAARAGEYGRGFSVVAKEIQKMALDSEKSVKEIKITLEAINENMKRLLEKIGQTVDVSNLQAAATQEISASAQQLSASTQTITEVAKII